MHTWRSQRGPPHPALHTQVSAMHFPLLPQSCPLPPHPVAFMQSSPPKPCLHIHLAFLKYLTVELSVCAITVHLPRYWPPHSLGHSSFSNCHHQPIYEASFVFPFSGGQSIRICRLRCYTSRCMSISDNMVVPILSTCAFTSISIARATGVA